MTFWRRLRNFTHRASFTQRASWGWTLFAILLALGAPAGRAQNLNWEGQTGAFVTPFAYTPVLHLREASDFPLLVFTTRMVVMCSEGSTKCRAPSGS
jgi:hypothetical protein